MTMRQSVVSYECGTARRRVAKVKKRKGSANVAERSAPARSKTAAKKSPGAVKAQQ
jgi:hypothetical protein